jgi:hypothetical protein
VGGPDDGHGNGGLRGDDFGEDGGVEGRIEPNLLDVGYWEGSGCGRGAGTENEEVRGHGDGPGELLVQGGDADGPVLCLLNVS